MPTWAGHSLTFLSDEQAWVIPLAMPEPPAVATFEVWDATAGQFLTLVQVRPPSAQRLKVTALLAHGDAAILAKKQDGRTSTLAGIPGPDGESLDYADARLVGVGQPIPTMNVSGVVEDRCELEFLIPL